MKKLKKFVNDIVKEKYEVGYMNIYMGFLDEEMVRVGDGEDKQD